MLIISRKPGESFVINDNIEINILEVQNDKIRIGIKAPKHVRVLRKELFETEKANKEASRSTETVDIDIIKKLIKGNQ